MENKNKSIHDFQFELICDYFSRLDRQGPGSREVTLKALSFIDGLSAESQIADVGCGSGTQTLYLAENTEGRITATDLFPKFIDQLKERAKESGFENRIEATVDDMCNLPFADESFDLIWSEGAIYNIGFEKGMREWRKFLKPNGYIAVSEGTWFTTERPKEIEDFWMANYPEIDLISTKVAQMEQAGYKSIAHFILPEECWLKDFYEPQSAARESFLNEYGQHEAAHEFIAGQQHEESLYNKYKDYYGYVFYIGQKI